jgi:hypothetical protein
MNPCSEIHASARRSGDAQMSVDFIALHGSHAIIIFVMSITAARRCRKYKVSPEYGRE